MFRSIGSLTSLLWTKKSEESSLNKESQDNKKMQELSTSFYLLGQLDISKNTEAHMTIKENIYELNCQNNDKIETLSVIRIINKIYLKNCQNLETICLDRLPENKEYKCVEIFMDNCPTVNEINLVGNITSFNLVIIDETASKTIRLIYRGSGPEFRNINIDDNTKRLIEFVSVEDS